jgi:uncharacterized protein (TIGR03083 family)
VTDVWRLVEVERTTLADFLETLSPEEWQVQSLCEAWNVREVAAHVAWGNTVPIWHTVRAVAKDGFRANRANARLAKEWGRNEPEVIIARLREVAANQRLTPGTKPIDALGDMLCHDLDIREPLGRQRQMPVEAFGLTMSRFARIGFPIALAYGRNPKATAKGLRLVADNLNWSIGDGPEVHASGSALLRAISGRAVARDELAGPGADPFYSRLT